MDLTEAMAALEAAGTEQNRKIYPRHGVKGPMFGVSHANLGNLQKQIKVDHALALQLWDTGNHDARVLAAKIADPARLTAKIADQWAKQCDNYPEVEAAAAVIAHAPVAEARAAAWRDKKGEWIASLGWAVSAHLALLGRLDATAGRQLLRQIEREIHDAPNRVRHEMNGCVIAIGTGMQECRQAALGAAENIGTVYVDHGETGCKTPDAWEYIDKTVKHRAQTRARRR
jgi:3-methyladenine DNA glycosylase AlkD